MPKKRGLRSLHVTLAQEKVSGQLSPVFFHQGVHFANAPGRKKQTFRGGNFPDSFVRDCLDTIAPHQAIDSIRRNARHQSVSLDQNREELPNGEVHSLVDLLETHGAGPLEQAEGEERRESIRASVDQFPDLFRQVVVLAYYQGLKYREIADVLDIPVGTVKSRLHAALAKLQEAWNESPSLREA